MGVVKLPTSPTRSQRKHAREPIEDKLLEVEYRAWYIAQALAKSRFRPGEREELRREAVALKAAGAAARKEGLKWMREVLQEVLDAQQECLEFARRAGLPVAEVTARVRGRESAKVVDMLEALKVKVEREKQQREDDGA